MLFHQQISLLLSIRLCWREIKPDDAKQLKNDFVASFSGMTTQRSRFGPNSCAADEQECVSGSCEFNKHSVLKILIINGLTCVIYKLVT